MNNNACELLVKFVIIETSVIIKRFFYQVVTIDWLSVIVDAVIVRIGNGG